MLEERSYGHLEVTADEELATHDGGVVLIVFEKIETQNENKCDRYRSFAEVAEKSIILLLTA